MRVVVVAVDIAAVADVAFQPMHGEVEAGEAAGLVGLLHAADGQLGGRVLVALGHEARRLHEHTPRTAGRVEDAAVVRLNHLGEQLHDAGGGVELAAALTLAHGELAKEVFVDAAEGVEVERGRDLGDLLEQLLEQGASEEVEGLGQHPSQLRVVLLHLAHGGVHLTADVCRLGQGEQEVEACFRGEVEDVVGMVGGGFIDPATPAGGRADRFQLGPLGGKAHLGEAQEDQTQDGAGVFLGLKTRVGAELVGGMPQSLFERSGGGIFFSGGDPVHIEFSPRSLWLAAHHFIALLI